MKKYVQRVLDELTEPEQMQAINDLSAKLQSAQPAKNRVVFSPISTWQDQIDERVALWGKLWGLPSGFQAIDDMTMGLAPGELIVIAGKTSHGKTTVALNIAAKVSKQTPVLFVTLEMSKPELGVRLQKICEVDDLYHVPVLCQESDELNWQDVDLLFEEASRMEIGLVVIDHLHYFSRALDNVAEDLGRVTKEIKKNALRYNLPVILISHVRKTDKKDAGIDDLRGSSYIAQDADIVLMVNRDPDDGTKLHLNIEKNRNRGSRQTSAVFKFDGVKILPEYVGVRIE